MRSVLSPQKEKSVCDSRKKINKKEEEEEEDDTDIPSAEIREQEQNKGRKVVLMTSCSRA